MTLRYSNTRKTALGLVALVALLAGSARPASAKIFELTLRLHAGGVAGLYGTENYDPLQADPDLAAVSGADFYKERRGATFGGVLGVEVFFVDLIYEFYQFADGDGLGSTLNNMLVGFDWDFKAGRKWVFTPYVVTGIGLATQNNSWLAKKYPQIALEDLNSRIVQVRVGLQIERKLGRFFRVGFEVGAGYHYMIQNASGLAANDLEGHSHGFHIMGHISLAFVWDPFDRKKKDRSGPQWKDDSTHTPPATGAPESGPPAGTPPPAVEPPPAATPPPVVEPPPAATPQEVPPPKRTAPGTTTP